MTRQAARTTRSVEQFAEMSADVARASKADVVVCVTESGRLFRCIRKFAPDATLVAATPSEKTYQALTEEGSDVVRLPVRVPNRFKEARHAIAVALQAGKVRSGDLVQCVIGQGLLGARGDFLVLTDVGEEAAGVPLHDLIKITDGVKASVLDATSELACRIGQAARRGKRIGAVFMLGDSTNVLEGARQLVLNPLQGHGDHERIITTFATHDMLMELAKLDGAFVVRGDGFIQTAGTFLEPGAARIEPLQGLGARHVTAAAVTARTHSIAIVVSATDGNVRVFSQGATVMQLDPEG